MAEASHTWTAADVGEICRNPAPVSVVAAADHTHLGGSGESRLKNPLRKICTAGSVRGEILMSHGGLNRARNWKRWIQPKNTYSSTRSPLLGGAAGCCRCCGFLRALCCRVVRSAAPGVLP